MCALWINTMDVKQEEQFCAGSLLFNCAQEGNIDKLKEILLKGSPLGTDTVGTTALHCAIIGNQLEACTLILKTGISVDVRTKVDRTPLHLAVFYGHEKIVRLLLSKHCEVDPVDMFKMTPLHWAVENRFPSIVRLLLERGANQYALSKFNKTPRSIAENEELDDIVHLFDSFSTGYTETNDSTARLLVEMKKEQHLVEEYEEEPVEHQEGEEEDDNDDIMETMSIFEEDDVVEVIPATGDLDSVEISLEEEEQPPPPAKKIKAEANPTRDESLSSLDKLGNIRGLKAADATTLKILQNIGIAMSEEQDPDPTIISNVLKSGRKIILSEAGKYMLKATQADDEASFPMKQPDVPSNRASPVKVMKQHIEQPSSKRDSSVSLMRRSKMTDMERELGRDIDSQTDKRIALPSRTSSGRTGALVLKRERPDVLDTLNDGGDAWAENEDGSVPLKRVERMEKQMLLLRRENQQLKNTLDVAVRQIEESQKRIERLEAVVNRKED